MSISEFNEIIESNDQTEARREHLKKLRELVGNVYPNKFERSQITGAEDTISNVLHFEPVENVTKEIKEHILILSEGEKPAPELKEKLNATLKEFGNVKVSGRLTTTPRTMGKAAFVHLSDGVNRLQVYVRRDDIKGVYNGSQLSVVSSQSEDSEPTTDKHQPTTVSGWDLFKLLDGGDFVGVGGFLFLTNTGELSVHVETLQFLSKALLPMPDKIHGIADPELNRRYRYADLIASSLRNKTDEEIEEEKSTGIKELTTREVFERRARLISGMRGYLDDNGFVEVETPILTPKATGAAAEPFETYHNALDIKLYARIAPELYLKRLMVGGFEKVYELNRNFRNEGLSHKHSPEFTMLEFYCAYMDVNGMMDFSEEMTKDVVMKANNGSLLVKYGENEIDFSKFERLSMKDSILRFVPDAEITDENLIGLFDENVEEKLIQPTFIIDYPKSISPLSKASPDNPNVAERFELFVNGMECANGFSELNDPQEQYERFADQMRERETGDEEAMVLDEDYIRALAYGMPPAAGIGIGIDRLVMLLTNRHSIRDVILFPHMRPEKREEDTNEN